MHSFRTTVLNGLAISAVLAAIPAVHAQVTTVYDNTKNFTGYSVDNGGASGTSPTDLIADDITPILGFAGQSVTSFTFSVANDNTTSTTFTPTVSIYEGDGDGGGPGTLLKTLTFSPLMVQGGGITLYTYTNATGIFALPADTFWAGISFKGASADALNNLGQGTYDPPTIGSSDDAYFASDNPAPSGSNPAGGIYYLGGNPVASFGWKFQVTNTNPAVPEASTTVSFGLLLTLGLGGVAIAARKKKATVSA